MKQVSQDLCSFESIPKILNTLKGPKMSTEIMICQIDPSLIPRFHTWSCSQDVSAEDKDFLPKIMNIAVDFLCGGIFR